MRRSVFLAATLMLSALTSTAQRSGNSTWDIFGGVNVLRSSMLSDNTEYHYGWIASVANRPYESRPWLGGVVEGSGIYNTQSGTYNTMTYKVTNSVHTAMGGPVVQFPRGRVRPFAHALFGGAFTDEVVQIATSQPTDKNDDYFATALGGGVDLRVRRHLFVRTQADWMYIVGLPTNGNSVRLSGGILLSY